MSESSSNVNANCFGDCQSAYEQCTSGKEHESVCRMKRAQCSCGCRLD